MEYLRYTTVDQDIGGIKRLSFIVDAIRMHAPARAKILDFGCGTGPVSLPLASLGYHVTGVDIDKKSIKIATKKNRFSNARFIAQPAEKISGKFEVIVASQVLEHVPDPDIIVQNLAKHLSGKGVMIITVPNGYGWTEFLKRIKQRLPKYRSLGATNTGKFTANEDLHLQFYTRKKLDALFSRHGLRIDTQLNHTSVFGAFPVSYLYFISPKKARRFIDRMDGRLADKIPSCMANGWYFIVRKK